MQDKFEKGGFAPFKEAYYQNWLHSDQQVVVQGQSENQGDVEVIIKGVTESGGLLAVDVDGSGSNRYELYPDGNSFDFFAGLIKRKM